METGDLLALFIVIQSVFIPILGGIYLGIKFENDRRDRLLKESLKALMIISVSRGRHLK